MTRAGGRQAGRVVALAAMFAATAATGCAGRTRPATDVTPPSDRTIAVLPMRVAARDTSLDVLGFGLAELLADDLSRARRLTLVERTRLAEVTRELQLGASGQVDAATAPRAGRLTGAGRLVVGTITQTPDGQFTIDAHVTRTADGSIEHAFTARAPVSDVLLAEKAIALRLLESLGVVLTPGERAGLERRSSPSLPALLAFSAGVRDEWRGDLASAVSRYRVATRGDAGFTAARLGLGRANAMRAPAAGGVRALATSAVAPSPITGMGAGTDAASAQARGQTQDRAVTAQMQAVFTTVVVQVRTTP